MQPTLYKNNLFATKPRRNGNFIDLILLEPKMFVHNGMSVRSKDFSLDKDSDYCDFYNLIENLFPASDDTVESLMNKRDYQYLTSIPLIPNAMSDLLFDLFIRSIEKDESDLDVKSFYLYRVFKNRPFYSDARKRNVDFLTQIKELFPEECQEIIGKRFILSFTEPHLRTTLANFLYFIIINEIVANYISTGKNTEIGNLFKPENNVMIDSIVVQFHTFNINYHEYSERIADMCMFDIEGVESSSLESISRFKEKKSKANVFKDVNVNLSDDFFHYDTLHYVFDSKRKSKLVDDSEGVLLPYYLSAKNIVDRLTYRDSAYHSIFSSHSPIHVFNTIPEKTEKRKAMRNLGVTAHDMRRAKGGYVHHNVFLYMDNNFTADFIEEMKTTFELVSDLALDTVPDHPEFSYSYSFNTFLFLAMVKEKNNETYEELVNSERKIKNLLTNVHRSPYFRWLTPLQMNTIVNGFLQTSDSGNLPLLTNTVMNSSNPNIN